MKIPLTPLRCLHRAVDLYGAKEAIICGDRRFTYAEFGERCERLASALSRDGVVAGDRVGYLSFNTHKLLEGYYGVIQAHAIVMPLNVRLTCEELADILRHSEPRLLFYEAEFAPVVATLLEAWPGMRTINLDTEYESYLDKGTAERADIFAYDEDSVAELFYTSGSTGTPKGVTLNHRTIYMHAMTVAGTFNREDTAVELHTIPLFHANGWGRPQTATMMGLKQVMVRRFEPAGVCRLIQQERATSMSVVPTMASALVLKAFSVAVVAGLESGFGVVVVGLFLGALESLASFYVGSGWREAPGLVLLILALAVRPTGVFGKAVIRKV